MFRAGWLVLASLFLCSTAVFAQNAEEQCPTLQKLVAAAHETKPFTSTHDNLRFSPKAAVCKVSDTAMSGFKAEIAKQLQIDPKNVRVVSPYVGGGFGSKGPMTPRTAIVAVAARRQGVLKWCIEIVWQRGAV